MRFINSLAAGKWLRPSSARPGSQLPGDDGWRPAAIRHVGEPAGHDVVHVHGRRITALREEWRTELAPGPTDWPAASLSHASASRWLRSTTTASGQLPPGAGLERAGAVASGPCCFMFG